MKLIGKACLCGHDTLDHYPEGCIRCRDRRSLSWLLTDWRHRFVARPERFR